MKAAPSKQEQAHMITIMERMEEEGRLDNITTKEIPNIAELLIEQLCMLDEWWYMCKIRHFKGDLFLRYKCVYEKLYHRCITVPKQNVKEEKKETPKKSNSAVGEKRTFT